MGLGCYMEFLKAGHAVSLKMSSNFEDQGSSYGFVIVTLPPWHLHSITQTYLGLTSNIVVINCEHVNYVHFTCISPLYQTAYPRHSSLKKDY